MAAFRDKQLHQQYHILLMRQIHRWTTHRPVAKLGNHHNYTRLCKYERWGGDL